MGKIKIRCEAIARHSGKRCKCKGYFTPTPRKMLCTYHRGSHSWDHKTRKYKATTLSNIVASRLNIPCFLVFYKNLTPDTLTFRIKRITSCETEFEVMNESQWVSILLDLQSNHRKVCKHDKD